MHTFLPTTRTKGRSALLERNMLAPMVRVKAEDLWMSTILNYPPDACWDIGMNETIQEGNNR